jgi:DNA polymerase-3 subunit epsilon
VKLLDLKLVFLDLQTTGASPATGAPLEMAWALGSANDKRHGLTRRYLLKQPDEQPVPKRIQALTGITDGDMENAVDWCHAETELRESVGKACLPSFVIHYAQFERPFLRELFDEFDSRFNLVCTHQIATRLFPNLPSRGIRGLAGYFGFPLDECKRADTHVTATFAIWKHLCGLLAEKEIRTWEQLQNWLQTTPKQKRTKYEYPLERGIRLAMPDCPGIYKMMSRRGDVLYVGKATSLKDRVNSYFRGKKHRDPKKLEMLTQAWDIKVEPCATVLEACLLEVREIKRLAPPYNIAMNTGFRPLLFYSEDFATCSIKQTDEQPVGPFRNEFVLDGFTRFLGSLRSGEWDQAMFFDEIDPLLIEEGFGLFLAQFALSKELISRPRSALAFGAWLCRQVVEEEIEDDADDEKEDEEIELTPEDVAAKFPKLLMRAAHAYLLSRKLTRLLNSTVTFTESSVQRTLHFAHPSSEKLWHNTDIETFDTLRVLHTELNRLKKIGERIEVIFETNSNDSRPPARQTSGPKERAYEPA